MAAVGPRGAISHVSALALWGAPVPRRHVGDAALIHVVTTAGRVRRPGIAGHEGARVEDFRLSPPGVLAVAPALAWCQSAELLSRNVLVAIGDFLVTGRRSAPGRRDVPVCSREELADAVRAFGRRRGVRVLRDALELVRAGVDSPRESELRLVLRDAGLPEPVIGHRVATSMGMREPDLAYPDRRIAFEYEGEHHRSDRRQWRADFARVRAFQTEGWTVIRVNDDDLRDEERRHALIGTVRSLLRRR